MIAALFSVMLLAAETPAATAETASPTTQEAAATAQPVKAEKQKKICKTDPSHTGSRMPRKLCMTQVEWEKHDSGRSAGDLKTIGGR